MQALTPALIANTGPIVSCHALGGVSGVDKAARVENADHNQAPIGGDKIGEVVNPDNYSMTPIRFCWRSAGGEFLRTSVRDRQLHSINPTR
jgi:hypothetical protein